MSRFLAIAFILSLMIASLNAQTGEVPPPSNIEKTVSHAQGFWLGYYTKFRVKKRLFYYGEYHMRRRDFMDHIDKIYLRFGAYYFFTKQLEFTLGIATPINFAKNPDDANVESPVLEFRFWEQALFVVPIKRSKTYHQIRLEQRWKRDYEKGSPYLLSYRWRYKFTIYVPINHDHLQPRTIFYSFYDEIFIQTGEGITYNIFEDNRMFNGLGYIINKNVQVQTGYLWNFHHHGSPYDFESKHIWRIAIYHYLDFYSKKQNSMRDH